MNLETPSIFLKHNIHIKQTDCSIELPKIKISLSETTPSPDINVGLYDIVSKYKTKIEEIINPKIWDKSKKISNDFERIHVPKSKYTRLNCVAKYSPLSRSYFKLWEMIKDFNLIQKQKKFTTAHIAEGPGGFIEAVIKYRNSNINDILYAITLRSDTLEIPGWNKSTQYLNQHKNIKISYGSDGTGDIYKINNIKHFVTTGVENNKMDLITADGGFDFSIDFNKQEQLSYRLVFCQIVIALSIQKEGGHFVCKLFDLFHLSTIKLIWLLHCFYETVYVTKPFTSRPANSEKYLVAKGFQGISLDYLEQLYNVVQLWETVEITPFNIIDIFDCNLPTYFLESFSEYNYHIVKRQIESIIKTLLLSNIKINQKLIKYIRHQQYYNAKKWCIEYSVTHVNFY